jgi:hypothetical protein
MAGDRWGTGGRAQLDLVGRSHSASGPGWPIAVMLMKGRSRAYVVGISTRETAAVRTIAFNDRCDAIVATVVVRGSEPAAIEPAARVP